MSVAEGWKQRERCNLLPMVYETKYGCSSIFKKNFLSKCCCFFRLWRQMQRAVAAVRSFDHGVLRYLIIFIQSKHSVANQVFVDNLSVHWSLLKGAQACDIRLQGFYTNQTCMGWWLRKIQNFDGLGMKIAVLYF